VFQNIAMKIIDFLNQIETFQKKVWEKKKFVIDTHYVISLDKIYEYCGEDFFHSILSEILSNKEQIREWKNLFDIEVASEKDLVENPEKLNFDGEKYKKLPIDTKHFDEEFKWKLLIALTENYDLDEVLDGVLIKSENWQALNLLLNKYSDKVQTIYIDPPYNTGNDGFLYKDKYLHSSWLTMIQNRIDLCLKLLKNSGIFFSSIANNSKYYYESAKLNLLLENVFPQRMGELIWKRRSGSGSNTIQGITEMHEYILCFGNEKADLNKNILTQDDFKKYKYEDEKGRYKWNDTVINQYTKQQRPNLYYPIFYDPEKDKIFFEKTTTDNNKLVDIYPSKNGKSVFFCDINSMKEIYKRGVLKIFKEGDKYKLKIKKYLYNTDRSINGNIVKSVLEKDNTQFKIGGTSQGTRELKDMFNEGIFKNPKPSSLISLLIYISTKINDENNYVLDFFAGSGTTAHAVMKLNQEDGGKRKFILVEMADYFDTIIIPRIKKLSYSFDWKEGKPQNSNGIGVFFKYHILEQYEDSLENIEFSDFQPSLYEFKDYFVKYMLDWETKKSNTFLNIDKLQDPFNYKLKIFNNYLFKTVNVDLVETFNYLLGLFVKKYKVIEAHDRKYLFTYGEKDNQNILIVWRSLKDIDFQQDKQIIEEIIDKAKPEKIYINGDAIVKNFEPIEPLFKNLMFEQVI